MAVGITATPNNADASVSLTVTGLTGVTSVSVTRNDPNGAVVPVRGASNVTTGGATTMAFFDFEAPLDRPVTYTATPDTGSAATSGACTIVTDGRTFWLKNVAQETLSVKVTVSKMSDPVRKARVLAQYDVLGRPKPIVISDVRSGRTGSMVLATNDPMDSEALVSIFEAGDALLLQFPSSVNFPDMYFVAGDLTEHILGVPQDPNRAFEFPYVEVDAPTDNLVSLAGNSWLLVTNFGSWANVMAKRTSWLDVLNRGWTDGDA